MNYRVAVELILADDDDDGDDEDSVVMMVVRWITERGRRGTTFCNHMVQMMHLHAII